MNSVLNFGCPVSGCVGKYDNEAEAQRHIGEYHNLDSFPTVFMEFLPDATQNLDDESQPGELPWLDPAVVPALVERAEWQTDEEYENVWEFPNEENPEESLQDVIANEDWLEPLTPGRFDFKFDSSTPMVSCNYCAALYKCIPKFSFTITNKKNTIHPPILS